MGYRVDNNYEREAEEQRRIEWRRSPLITRVRLRTRQVSIMVLILTVPGYFIARAYGLL